MKTRFEDLTARHQRLVTQYFLWESKEPSPIRTVVLDVIQDSLGVIESMIADERKITGQELH